MNDRKLATFLALALASVASPATAKPMIEYFQPIPIRGTITTSGWGIGTSGPRDTGNGIEDIANWRYWDGKILKADDGKYHLFCSKWAASKGIAAWMSDSVSVHAVSDNVLGPYKEIGLTYSYQNGRGHNTTGLKLMDGTYAVIESAIVPGWIFTSSSLDGPFNYKGSISTDNNGINASNLTSNLQIMVGPDNKYWAISGSGFIMNGDNILGTYKVRTPSVYMPNPGMNNGRAEDPILWYSGGYYHVVYNYWDARRAYHIMSPDGVNDWKNTGVAVDRSTDAFRHTDGTVNHWGNMERPNVVMENGHVTHFTFAVTDVNKDQGSNCCSTGSKIIVVPFDGVAFDADNGGQTGGSGGAGGSGGSAAGADGRGMDAGAGGGGGRTGSDGAGGTSAAGGAGSSGSDASDGASGGSSDAAGRSGSGGTSGTAGDGRSGGSPGAGGANDTGGSGSGGISETAASSSGGSIGVGSGGSPGAGGANGTGGSGSGGSSEAAGSSSGGSTGTATPASNSASGCSCSTNETQRSDGGGLVLLLGLAIAFATRKHARRTRPGGSASCDFNPSGVGGRARARQQLKVVAVASLTAGLPSMVHAAPQQWMDYFQPTPIVSPLSSTCWGAAQVGPRDQSNGLEDKTLASWDYWDGGIIKDETTGTYHMFASRWSKSRGHNGWMSDSRCVHATSTNLYGPYTDKGQCYTDNGGMCHNVNALRLREGDTCGKKFAITCSGSVGGSGRVYGSDSLDGPWTYVGDLKLDLNGHTGRFFSGDNFRTILRPDGKYECINGLIGIADNVIGPYKAQMSGRFTDTVPGHIPDSCRNNMEDPFIFYSGSQYHVMYNCWSASKAFFYSSTDGINWKAEDGYAYDPTSSMVRYTDGTINHWKLLERPSVYIENGHAVAMTFAAINSPKDQDTASTKNGSKVIVVPVDGLSFDSGGPPGSVAASGGTGGGLDAGSGGGGRGGSGGSTSSGSSTGGTIGSGGASGMTTAGSGGTARRGEGGSSAGSSAAGGATSTGGRSGTDGSAGGERSPGGASARGDGGSGAVPAGGAGGSSVAATGGVTSGGTIGPAGGAGGGAGTSASGGAIAKGGSTSASEGSSSGCGCTVGARPADSPGAGVIGLIAFVTLALTLSHRAGRPRSRGHRCRPPRATDRTTRR